MPISFNIFYLSVFVVADPRTLWTGPRELLLNAFLILAYGGWMTPIFRARTAPRPLWDASYDTARVSHTPT
jgi:predicted neuraminidase